METQKTNGQSGDHSDYPVFNEYSNNRKGWPFITVVQAVEGKRRVTGRIFREYDNENKKAVYKAFDGQGNPIFTDLPDLVSIKKAFVSERKVLALRTWERPAEQKNVEPVEKKNREAGLQKIRERNTGNEQKIER